MIKKSNATLDNIYEMLSLCPPYGLKTVEDVLEAVIAALMQSKESSNNIR